MKTLLGYLTILLFVFLNTNLYSQKWRALSGDKPTSNFCKHSQKGKADDGNLLGARLNSVTIQGANSTFIFGGKGIGSRGQSVLYNDLWKFDEKSNRFIWLGGQLEDLKYKTKYAVFYSDDEKSLFPCPREGSVAWCFANKIYLFGGMGIDSNYAYKYLNDLWCYDLLRDKWTQIDFPNSLSGKSISELGDEHRWPSGRKSMMSWLVGNDLYFLGGQGLNSENRLTMLTDFWKFSISENYWTELSKDYSSQYLEQKIPSTVYSKYPLVSIGAVVFQNEDKLYLWGGYKYDDKSKAYEISNAQWCFDLNKKVWRLDNMDFQSENPIGRTDALYWRKNNEIYVYGGLYQREDGNKIFNNDFWKYDLSKSLWVKINKRVGSNVSPYALKNVTDSTNTPGSRHNSISFTSGNKLYLVGGMVYNGYTFQISDDIWICDLDSQITDTPILTQNTGNNGSIVRDFKENSIPTANGRYVDTVIRSPEKTKWNCKNLGIFPNPTISTLNLSNVKVMEDCFYSIRNRSGIVIQQGNIPGAEYKHIVSFDVGRLESGNYFITLTSKDDMVTCPFQKK